MAGEISAASRLGIDLGKPQFDQSTFIGRAKRFSIITNPKNILASSKDLNEAKGIVIGYKNGASLPGITAEKLWAAKYLYDSTFHPDTGEKMFILGRMSAQVPMNMTITGCMMTFYKTTPAVIFWQWINQSFNAVVNYTNRSGDKPIGMTTLGLSYAGATTGAIVTALGLNKLAPRFPSILGRYVPFAAVAAANCVNIPMMRNSELKDGIPVLDSEGNRVGNSQAAARSAISQVIISRIIMAVPGMFIPPIIMQKLEKPGRLLHRYPKLGAPLQVGMVGFLLIFATPLCCALFPQISSISVSKLETGLQDRLRQQDKRDTVVYFNKGL